MVVLNVASDAVLWVDIYVNFNLSYTQSSETIWEPLRSAPRYFKGGFLFDLLTALPVSGFSDTTFTYTGRIPRLLRSVASRQFSLFAFDSIHRLTCLRELCQDLAVDGSLS